jgi:PAS domain S-box-containing protein
MVPLAVGEPSGAVGEVVLDGRGGVTAPGTASKDAGRPGGGRSVELAAEQFRLLVEGVKDYAIFLLDPGGYVVSWNAGAERIKGYTTAEILGEHFSRFYLPQDKAAGRPARALAEAAREGRFEAYGWRVRRDGSRFYAHVTLTALTDPQGRLRGFAKITQDVTAQREAERLLRQREQLLAEAQAIAQLGSFEWDLTTGEVTWSPELCRIHGLEPGSVTGTLEELLARVHPDDQALVRGELRRAAAGSGYRLEQRIVRPTGEVRVLSGWARPTTDEHGRPVRVIGVCQDVTEQRRDQERLAEAHAQEELSRRLQRGLLPTLALRDPALALRTRYQPGLRRALLGADFYDALELADGSLATLIGDVAGHGPDEAAVGVALRSAWRAMVLTGRGHAEVLGGMDNVLASSRPSEETFTTVCCLWVSPDRQRLTVALAGHPPPLLAAEGVVAPVGAPIGPALGVCDGGWAWEARTLPVEGAWTLLCYTDGLIEGLRAPGSAERFGIEQLGASLVELLAAEVPLDRLLDRLLDVVHRANGGDLSDDVALLCLAVHAGRAAAPAAWSHRERPW